ncbi:MAG: DUF4214 domain-containing protein [Acidimicrobiales bacterium]
MRSTPTRALGRRAVELTAAALLAAGLGATPVAAHPTSASTAAPDAPTVSSETFTLDGLGTAARNGASDPVRLDVAEGTQSVGLTWAGPLPATIEVRGRTAGGWTPWQHLDGDPAEGPDEATRTGTPLAWLDPDGVDAVEVRAPSRPLPDLELQAIRADASASSGPAAPSIASSDGRPAIHPRSDWTSSGWVATNPGCTPAPEEEVTGVGYAVVHHTDTPNGYSAADVPALIASIAAYHTGSNRWCDIGYNLLVDRFGGIWEGRSGGVANPVIGSHAQGFNDGSVGVALLGNHQTASPSAAALAAAGRVIGWKLALHRHDPQATVQVTSGGGPKYRAGTVVTLDRVIGHRDVGLTSCPGALLYPDLDAIAQAATAYQATLPEPAPPLAPFRLEQDLVLQQYRDVLRRDPTPGPMALATARLAAGGTPGELVSYLVRSDEAEDLLHATTRLYRAYFRRNPDHSGFDYWVRRREGGTTLARISNTFAASSEFRRTYGSITDAEFVDLIYRNVLGRTADPGGRDYWTRKVAAGTSRGVVMLQFSQSSEYVRATREGTWVVATYEALLQRAVTDTAYDVLVADLRSGARDEADVATSLLVSDSYRRRIAPVT